MASGKKNGEDSSFTFSTCPISIAASGAASQLVATLFSDRPFNLPQLYLAAPFVMDAHPPKRERPRAPRSLLTDILNTPALLDMIGTEVACRLRATCSSLRSIVAEHSWDDSTAMVQAPLARWRACFPSARSVLLVVNDDSPTRHGEEASWADLLEGLAGITVSTGASRMSTAAASRVTSRLVSLLNRGCLHSLRRLELRGTMCLSDESLRGFSRLERLCAEELSFARFSLAGFSCLGGVRSLRLAVSRLGGMRSLRLADRASGAIITCTMLSHLVSLTDLSLAGFVLDVAGAAGLGSGLSTLKTLNLEMCTAVEPAATARIDDRGAFDLFLAHVSAKLTSFSLTSGDEFLISSAAIARMTSLEDLRVVAANASFEPAAFTSLQRLKSLALTARRPVDVDEASQRILCDEALHVLPNLTFLSLNNTLDHITTAGLRSLCNLVILDISATQDEEYVGSCLSVLGPDAFSATPLLEELSMAGRGDISFPPGCTGAAVFAPLALLRTLNISHCTQPELDDDIFYALPSLKRLDISFCTQFTAAVFPRMRRLERLHMDSCSSLPHSDATMAFLDGLIWLSMKNCLKAPVAWCLFDAPAPAVTSTGWESLRGVQYLDVRGNDVPEEAQAVLRAHVPHLQGCGV